VAPLPPLPLPQTAGSPEQLKLSKLLPLYEKYAPPSTVRLFAAKPVEKSSG
jgi:hypothetical protein